MENSKAVEVAITEEFSLCDEGERFSIYRTKKRGLF